MNIFDLNFNLRRLVVELVATVSLAICLSIAIETATDLSGRFVTVGIAVFAVSAVEVAGWLWDANPKKTEAA